MIGTVIAWPLVSRASRSPASRSRWNRHRVGYWAAAVALGAGGGGGAPPTPAPTTTSSSRCNTKQTVRSVRADASRGCARAPGAVASCHRLRRTAAALVSRLRLPTEIKCISFFNFTPNASKHFYIFKSKCE